jgi:hypothetical protein
MKAVHNGRGQSIRAERHPAMRLVRLILGSCACCDVSAVIRGGAHVPVAAAGSGVRSGCALSRRSRRRSWFQGMVVPAAAVGDVFSDAGGERSYVVRTGVTQVHVMVVAAPGGGGPMWGGEGAVA